MNCWQCNTELIWGGDHDFEDYGMEEDGVVTNLSCPECSSFVLVYTPLEEPMPEYVRVDNDSDDRWSNGYRIGYHQMKQFLGKKITQLEKERDHYKELAKR